MFVFLFKEIWNILRKHQISFAVKCVIVHLHHKKRYIFSFSLLLTNFFFVFFCDCCRMCAMVISQNIRQYWWKLEGVKPFRYFSTWNKPKGNLEFFDVFCLLICTHHFYIQFFWSFYLFISCFFISHIKFEIFISQSFKTANSDAERE
jgi:hypothetical protein